MIRIAVRTDRGQLTGFTVSGHAGAGPAGHDIVCAAVSSAAYMTANTVTEILHCPADIKVSDGYMQVLLTDGVPAAQAILSGFRLHMQALQDQYPRRVQLSNTEV